jgi:hypothetical protein
MATATKQELINLLERFHGEYMVKYCHGEPLSTKISERWLIARMRLIEKRLPHLRSFASNTNGKR